MNDQEFEDWKTERNIAIGGTFEEFKTYAIKMGQVPTHPEAMEIMYHKCRTALTILSDEVRQESHKWLLERGYQSMM
jgi:hypothetical protein